MKKLITTLLSLLLFAAFVSAQNVDQRVEQRLSKMDIELGLSPAQLTALRPAVKQNVESGIENEKRKGTPEFQVAAKTNYQKFQKALSEILTPEQHQKWKAYIAEYTRAKQTTQGK